MLDADLVLHVGGILAAAAATYGAIRADIRHMHERLNDAERNIVRAHERIDHILTERS